MKLSIIWISSDDLEKEKITYTFLKEEEIPEDCSLQLIIYSAPQSAESTDGISEEIINYSDLEEQAEVNVYEMSADASAAEICNRAASKITGDYVTVLESGDKWSKGAFVNVFTAMQENSQYRIITLDKYINKKRGAFSRSKLYDPLSEVCYVHLKDDFSVQPFYLGGTILRTDIFLSRKFRPQLGLEAEREYLLSLCAEEMEVLYLPKYRYYSNKVREGNTTFFAGIYQSEWYEQSFDEFWMPFFEKLENTYGKVPEFIQYNFMFSVCTKIKCNWNNQNKHVAEDGEACLNRIKQGLQYIDDEIIFNYRNFSECSVPDSLKWVYGVLKYGPSFRFQVTYISGTPYYTCAGVVFNRINRLATNITFMDYKDNILEVDATIHPILFSMAREIYFEFNSCRYEPVYNGRYAHTKAFGVSIYKGHSCHVSVPMPEEVKSVLYCYAVIGENVIKINFSYNSHFSRMSGSFKKTYWKFGDDEFNYLMVKHHGGLLIKSVEQDEWKKQEKALSREMYNTHKKRDRLFLCIRKAYFAARPFLKTKPIWMYLDKIYKGGDSSEYLYKYASRQDNNFRHYYLIDKHSPDYKRLKKEGYRPLVRGSIKHRLVFLLADMMVISNSTVFAFNDFPTRNSRFVRDLTDFHVCCVQHGMSVQKIAVAQNRLRDNIRLYFCASKYEIENLSKPIYGYEGYDALKLTGVPRYDGLVDRAKKQIMISPTWRMQAAMPVKTNEGRERDYNPLFRESTYFRVYNSLINDERLINAAQTYGYTIKYVLHPIVSSQVDDFDKNEFVEIIPASGDMSYEAMFCESALMVTDFSGIQFDFAYMRKPVVYLHHRDIPQHYEEGTFFYDTMGFGEICHDNDELIDLLIEYMQNGCKMKKEYVKRADDFFYYDDHNNCKRVYETMLKYQEENILNKNKKQMPDA